MNPERTRLFLNVLSVEEVLALLDLKLDKGAQCQCGSTATLSPQPPTDLFGAGSDGGLVFDGTSTVLGLAPSSNIYTLNRSIFAESIIVQPGVTVKTAGYRLFVAGTLTNHGAISHAGNNGATATNQNSAPGGATVAAAEVGGATSGGTGSAGSTGNGANGGTGATGSNSGGGAGAVGGASGAVPGTSTGANGGAAGGQTVRSFRALNHHLLVGISLLTGGIGGGGGAGGGGGGGSNFGGAGGGGGSGGGIMLLFAHTILNYGRITAAGGNGGNGANGTAGNAGGGGGGAGGGGGLLYLAYTLYDGTGALTATGGLGGAPGNGLGTGTAGSPGANGSAGTILRYNTTRRIWE